MRRGPPSTRNGMNMNLIIIMAVAAIVVLVLVRRRPRNTEAARYRDEQRTMRAWEKLHNETKRNTGGRNG